MIFHSARKVVLIILMIFTSTGGLYAQQYAGRWKNIRTLESKGLYRTALGEVRQVYQQAKTAGDRPEQIKALIYQMKYADILNEDALPANILQLSEEAAAAPVPEKEILESMLAELYWNYLQQHRYQLYNRTAVQDDGEKDIRTWSAGRLNREIADHYRQSLEPSRRLQEVDIRDYDTLLLRGKNTTGLRPTLYDLLAQRALDYFTGGERNIMQAADHFEIADPRDFAPAAKFSGMKFHVSDTSSGSYKAIHIFQELLRFHLQDPSPEALLDADIRRLQYVYQVSVSGDRDSLFLEALEAVCEKYPESPASAQAGYLAAQLLYQQGSRYQPFGDTSTRWDIAAAVRRCESIVKKFPGSEGGYNCRSLLLTILEPRVGMQTEKVNIPDQPFRTLVSYRNLSVLHFRLLRIGDQDWEHLSLLEDTAYWNALLSLPSYDNWMLSFPAPGDYQQHAAEIKVHALPPGSYVLTASGDGSFSTMQNPLAAQLFFVSDISCTGDNQGDYFVLNRETGRPLQGTRVRVWENKYDYSARRYAFRKAESYTTDANGYFRLKDTADYRGIRFEFSWQKDHLLTGDFRWVYEAPEASSRQEIKPHTFLFTDRSIYRPGQRIWFKGIMVTTDPQTHKSAVMPGKKTTVYLCNANGQITDSLSFTTSEWGSYAGSFALPQGELNGQMFLQDQAGGGRAFFYLEEYKRPSFYVEIKKPAGTYRLGDTVRITGDAMAYAGADIGGAIVSYRVTRLARFPFPFYYRRFGPMIPSSQMEIAQGKTSTGVDGKFTVAFPAIPDRIISPNAMPVFDYKISVDVTDVNGETRSGNLTVPVGYRSLFLSLDLPAEAAADSLRNISVITANFDGVFEPAKVTLSIYKLNPPERFIRQRYWQRPDQYVMDQTAYLKNFPHDEYANEADPSTWQRVEKIGQQSQITEAGHRFDMGNPQIPPGWYLVEAAARDEYGREVKDQKFVQVYDDKQQSLPFEAMLWTAPLKTTAEPATSGSFLLGTSAKDLYGIQQVIRMNGTGKPSLVHLNKEMKKVTVPVEGSDRGGIGYQYIFVRDNRIYTAYIPVNVPWDNKVLNITYETFRDKLLPGSQEHWKLRIIGSRGGRVAAEMLASMYDASLDAFRRHDWPPLDLYPVLSSAANWDQTGFSMINAQQYFRWKNPLNGSYEKIYDQLNWFGYQGGMGKVIRIGDANAMSVAVRPVPAPNSVFTYSNGENLMGVAEKRESSAFDTLGTQTPPSPETPPGIRRNLQETAFFFPQLQTDKNGEITLDFTLPEALTRWKFMAFAHTRDLAYGYTQREVVTQKQLMVMPNPPRFLREGDQVALNAKVVNLSGKLLDGEASLQLFNAETMQPVDTSLVNQPATQRFSVAAGQSASLSWPLEIPAHFTNPLLWRIVARAGDYRDGEEDALPVLTNRALVTETLPLPVRGNQVKTFRLEKLLRASSSKTLQHYGLTVEFTGNPAWYAVQALPYLSEKINGCSEQVFNRYYAGVLAEQIVHASPRIRKIFEQWKKTDSSALMSNLEKNQQLKSALLQETPWVMEAKDETAQKHRVAELFDTLKAREAAAASLQQLQTMQTPDGGFAWFAGMPDDRYITQYILTGIGRLQHLKVSQAMKSTTLREMVDKAIAYLDARIREDYETLLKHKVKLGTGDPGNIQVQYLYMRSFFGSIPVASASRAAYRYYLGQAAKYWVKQTPYLQGMIALALRRNGDQKTAAAILRSLKETAIRNEETGMYWKGMTVGYYWYQAPVETESLLIEAFEEAGHDPEAVEEMKTWLLKQKQTERWRTTRATADAVYALLMERSHWLEAEPDAEITLGSETVRSGQGKTEAGTGYFMKRFSGTEVKPDMGNIKVRVSDAPAGEPSWGTVYWQYFEQLDKITPAAGPLQVSKRLFIEKNTAKGPELIPVTEASPLKVGDRVRVRIELRADRDLEYVHLRNMRAACFEPVNVLSGYRWQGGAGFYETTKDASTDLFFGWLPRGTYVFEIPLFVMAKGDFSNGMSTVQCLYAPEFSSHTEGTRIKVQ